MTTIRSLPGTYVQAIAVARPRPAQRVPAGHPSAALLAAVATISNRMRLNIFAHRDAPEPTQPAAPPPAASSTPAQPSRPPKTYPADLIVWGIVVRGGFDEMDDPWYHRGVTQHAYVEGNDLVALCGFRPPISGPRERRRPRLGMPNAADHPMCGMCARMVVAPRPRVPVPVQPFRPAVAMPVAPGAVPPPAASSAGGPPRSPAMPGPRPPVALGSVPQAPMGQAGPPPAPAVSPWVKRYAGAPEPGPAPLAASSDAGLLARGVHLTDDD